MWTNKRSRIVRRAACRAKSLANSVTSISRPDTRDTQRQLSAGPYMVQILRRPLFNQTGSMRSSLPLPSLSYWLAAIPTEKLADIDSRHRMLGSQRQYSRSRLPLLQYATGM